MGRFPSLTIHRPRGSLPVLLSIPHAGREYGADILAIAAQGRPSLESLEDPLVDRLCWRAIASGIGAVIQNVSRATIDCNRDENEVDPAAVTGVGRVPVGPRARFGLGLIPSRTHRHGALWRRPIDRDELELRLQHVYRPYHAAIATLLEGLGSRFGEAILIDCHSMPSRRGQADIIVGDRHGISAGPWVAEMVAGIARDRGFSAALNEPYAGGAIAARHGSPGRGIHAIQIEIDRSLYLKADGRNPGVGFDRIACLVESVAIGLGEEIVERDLRAAAE